MTNLRRVRKASFPIKWSLTGWTRAMTRLSPTGTEPSLGHPTQTSTTVSTCSPSSAGKTTLISPLRWDFLQKSTSHPLTNKMDELTSTKTTHSSSGMPKETLTLWSMCSWPWKLKWLQTRKRYSLLTETCTPELRLIKAGIGSWDLTSYHRVDQLWSARLPKGRDSAKNFWDFRQVRIACNDATLPVLTSAGVFFALHFCSREISVLLLVLQII